MRSSICFRMKPVARSFNKSIVNPPAASAPRFVLSQIFGSRIEFEKIVAVPTEAGKGYSVHWLRVVQLDQSRFAYERKVICDLVDVVAGHRDLVGVGRDCENVTPLGRHAFELKKQLSDQIHVAFHGATFRAVEHQRLNQAEPDDTQDHGRSRIRGAIEVPDLRNSGFVGLLFERRLPPRSTQCHRS